MTTLSARRPSKGVRRGTMNLKTGLIAGAFAVLTVIAALGWTRKSEPQPAVPNSTTEAQPASVANSTAANANPPNYTRPVSYDAYGQPVFGASNSSSVAA